MANPKPENSKARTLTIDPVTRLEGHAKITLHLDDKGRVADARFHVTEFRGFEKFCDGRPLWEMPGITGRICGICPVSHLLASAKAGDEILAVAVPSAATKLRRLMNLGQIVQSHALSFFHLSAPDLLLGMDSEPASRNVFGLMAAEPELARGGIRLRQFGQEIIESLGGKKIHPCWAVPGGVRGQLVDAKRTAMQDRIPEALRTAREALALFQKLASKFEEEAAALGDFPSLFMGLVGEDGTWEHYDGTLRFVDATGSLVADGLDPRDYRSFIGEATESWSYLKFPYYRDHGYPDGMYRVGPLARLNLCERMGTPLADEAWQQFRDTAGGKPVTSSFYYHYARLVEMVGAIERIEILLDDPEILSDQIRSNAGVNRLRGVGVSEAPRGTLFHDYTVDEHGLIEKTNMIIATGQNNLAMNRTVLQAAQHYITGNTIPEGLLNRIEAGVRAFDPCLSCSTHAFGQMPLQVALYGPEGGKLDERTRD